jgi:paraquat-inducible protein B
VSESVVVETRKRKISGIWVVPLVAVVLGLWLAVDAYLKQGPTITLYFPDAEGLQADKTLVKVRAVTVGTVTGVRLADDLEGVVVTAELTPEARQLLREDSQFWVVRAEVRGTSVTGIGTLLSGAYIEISPGEGAPTREREFVGLDRRPISPVGTPGKRLKLVSESSGSVSVGSPILYRGYRVGTVESIELQVESQRVIYSIFVDAPYDALVSTNARFWNASGVSAELSTEGIKVSIGSLQSALMGGVAFDLPRNTSIGQAVESDTVFRLYPDEASIHQNPFSNSKEYVVSFKQSLRGLNPGAPVTYRGIRIGSVVRIMLADLTSSASTESEESGRAIPVLIRLEPGRFAIEDTEQGVAIMEEAVAISVQSGLRATLASGNLLTGARLIELDVYETESLEELGEFLGYPTIPTVSGGLAHIQVQISQLLDKINGMPLEGVLERAESAITELEGTLVALRRFAESEGLQTLPVTVQATLDELNEVLEGFDNHSEFQQELIRTIKELKSALQNVDSFAEQLSDKPNSLVFPQKQSPDPEPRVEP